MSESLVKELTAAVNKYGADNVDLILGTRTGTVYGAYKHATRLFAVTNRYVVNMMTLPRAKELCTELSINFTPQHA